MPSRTDKTITQSSPANKPERKKRKTNPGEQNSYRTSAVKNLSTARSRADEFIDELEALQIEFVDNRKQSNIIWVIHSKENKDLIENTISKYSFKSTLERRGAIATGNRPAWRIMT